jgi:hypothetical protein
MLDNIMNGINNQDCYKMDTMKTSSTRAGFEPRLKTSGISLTLNLLLGLRVRRAGILEFKNVVISTVDSIKLFSPIFGFVWKCLEIFDLDGHNLGTVLYAKIMIYFS